MADLEIEVGLVIDRLEPMNPWGSPLWLPSQILEAVPGTPPWTEISRGGDRIRYFAGPVVVSLYASHASFYADNLSAERPRLWVAMRAGAIDPPLDILAVTADPTEGEGYTETGTNVVEVIDMPPWMASEVAAFSATHHVERVFEKRKRDRRPAGVVERKRPIES